MIDQARVAVIGVGNNVSALVQGIALYRATGSLAGIRTPVLDGLGVCDIEFVAAFATSQERIGRDLTDAIFLPPNNFPRLTAELPLTGVTVRRGLTDAAEVERVAAELSGAEVVLYAAPSGRPETARLRRGGTPGGGGVHQHHLRFGGPRPAVVGSVRRGRPAAAGRRRRCSSPRQGHPSECRPAADAARPASHSGAGGGRVSADQAAAGPGPPGWYAGAEVPPRLQKSGFRGCFDAGPLRKFRDRLVPENRPVPNRAV
jgi:hypothetical protein